MMGLDTGRRRFLELAGTGATLSLAGCTAPSPQGGLEESEDTSGTPTTVTVALAIDQATLQETQESLAEKVQNGTINQTEMQEQFYASQAELLTEAASAVTEQAGETETLSIEQTASELGVMQVSGTPATLISLLGNNEVRGLLSAETFEEAIAQQQSDA